MRSDMMNINLTNLLPIITTIALIIALIVSYLAYRHSKQSRRSSIFTELTKQANIINEATAKYKIRSPYAVLLNIKSSDDIERFEALGAVFFHHINLLNMVYRNRKYLGKEVEFAYKEWVNTIFRPWLESDQKLIEMWDLARKSRDLLGKDFIEWLEPQLPIHRKMTTGNANADGV